MCRFRYLNCAQAWLQVQPLWYINTVLAWINNKVYTGTDHFNPKELTIIWNNVTWYHIEESDKIQFLPFGYVGLVFVVTYTITCLLYFIVRLNGYISNTHSLREPIFNHLDIKLLVFLLKLLSFIIELHDPNHISQSY